MVNTVVLNELVQQIIMCQHRCDARDSYSGSLSVFTFLYAVSLVCAACTVEHTAVSLVFIHFTNTNELSCVHLMLPLGTQVVFLVVPECPISPSDHVSEVLEKFKLNV